MKRTAILRKRPDADYASVPVRKEAKRRVRKCALKSCRQPFEPRNMSHKCCSIPCSIDFAIAERVRKERKERQEGLQKLKRRADHLKDAQTAFNAFIRARDVEQPCICCGRATTKVTGLGSHGWDSGHYRSTGSAPHLRFNEDNAHRQLVYCNRNKAGNAVDYRVGLIARIGLARVEALEADQTPRKWTIEQLIAIKQEYRAKLRALTNQRKSA